MRLNVFHLFLLMGCDSSSHPPAAPLTTVPPSAEWLACTKNSMCSATWLSCHGWLAISSSHESDVQSWYRTANNDFLRKAECDGPPQYQPIAICDVGSCRLE